MLPCNTSHSSNESLEPLWMHPESVSGRNGVISTPQASCERRWLLVWSGMPFVSLSNHPHNEDSAITISPHHQVESHLLLSRFSSLHHTNSSTLFGCVNRLGVQIHFDADLVEVRDKYVSMTMEQFSTPIAANTTLSDEEVPTGR